MRHYGRRGAWPARREERAYREYVSDEQRSRRGCIGGQMVDLSLSGCLVMACSPVEIAADLRNELTGLCDQRFYFRTGQRVFGAIVGRLPV